jgi:anthranilate synthase component 1
VKTSRLSFSEFERLARAGGLVPVWREIPGDTETPVSAFLKLPSSSHAFLLESAHAGEFWGRYSFLGDRPLATLTHRGRKVEITEGGRTRTLSAEGDPLVPLRQLLKEHRLARVAGLGPFVGGLVGYLGWGAIRWFEPRVPQRHGADPLFPDGEWMLAGRVVVFDNLTHGLKLVACTGLGERSTRDAYANAQTQLDELEEALRRPLPASQPVQATGFEDVCSREEFERAVARAREYIAAGDCMQVVLSRRIRAHFVGEPFEIYRALRRVSPTPYLFFLRFGDRALAGASPELLVRVQDGKATVRPIAGTRPRGPSPTEDAALEQQLRTDPKERAEHVMLVDLGRNDLGRVSAGGTVQVEEREVVERYSHVMHLVSQVSGQLRAGLDALDVLQATFPAGTVSGAPKVRAMEIIDELEPTERGPYAGAAGYLGFDGNCDLAISIRTVAVAGNELRLHAGAGIVHDSDPATEYAETEHKLGAARAALEGGE